MAMVAVTTKNRVACGVCARIVAARSQYVIAACIPACLLAPIILYIGAKVGRDQRGPRPTEIEIFLIYIIFIFLT